MNPRDRVGEYVLLEKLGEGGFGEVWKAENPDLPGRVVAVKIPTDPAYVAALRREGRIEFAIDHPNVVKTLTLNTSADPPYMVMEYVPGESLRARLTREGKLSPEEATRIICEVLDALGFAHERGIVHRDIKPDNILLAADGNVKVADFGLGKVTKATALSVQRSHDWTGQQELLPSDSAGRQGSLRFSGRPTASYAWSIAGTIHYMAPEQVRGEPGDGRTDLYSCGVLLYEMLTGKAHPLKLPIKGVAAAISAFVERCLEEDAGARFQSAHQCIRAIQDPQQAPLREEAPPVRGFLPPTPVVNPASIGGGSVRESGSRQPRPSAFRFRSGREVNSLEEFQDSCVEDGYLEDALFHLYEGHFEPWLRDRGHPELAEAASYARNTLYAKDPEEALGWFLSRFETETTALAERIRKGENPRTLWEEQLRAKHPSVLPPPSTTPAPTTPSRHGRSALEKAKVGAIVGGGIGILIVLLCGVGMVTSGKPLTAEEIGSALGILGFFAMAGAICGALQD